MTTFAPLVATAVGIVTVTMLLRALTRQRSPATRSFALGALMLTLAVPIQIQPFYGWLTIGGYSFAWPLQHVLALATAYLIPAGFAHATDAAPARFLRTRLIWFWVAVAVVLVAFAVAPQASDWSFEPHGRYRAGGWGHPAGAVAYVAFGVYLTHAVATLFVLSRRAARLADAVGNRWLGIGMRIHAAGEVPVFVFSTHMAVYNVLLLLGFLPPWAEARVDDALIPIGSGTVLLGLAVSAVAAVSRTALAQGSRDWWRYDRHRLVIHPLWTAVTTTMPSVRYSQLRKPSRLPFTSSGRQSAYRTALELRDALVLLCQVTASGLTATEIHRRATERGAHRGLTGDDLSAAVAATMITTGLAAWRGGARPDTGPAATPPVTAATTLAAELRWWRTVAEHCAEEHHDDGTVQRRVLDKTCRG